LQNFENKTSFNETSTAPLEPPVADDASINKKTHMLTMTLNDSKVLSVLENDRTLNVVRLVSVLSFIEIGVSFIVRNTTGRYAWNCTPIINAEPEKPERNENEDLVPIVSVEKLRHSFEMIVPEPTSGLSRLEPTMDMLDVTSKE
jgi:hypothetical protein